MPDPDDEHVVAAAVVAGAGVIVTSNLKDFPRSRLPSTLEALSPGAFAVHTVSLDPLLARQAVEVIAQRSGRHGRAFTADQMLERLHRTYAMRDAVELMRTAEGGSTQV